MVFCVGAMFAHGGLQPDDITIKTDEELTALTARWNELSSSERRLLLHEVRARMQASKISAQKGAWWTTVSSSTSDAFAT